ncbi:MAG: universal stress protein [Solirubrobacteraceae bacterium]
MLGTIAIGTDGSAEAHDAVALGTALAGATGAALWLVGVYSTPLLPVTGVSDRATLHDQAYAVLHRDQEQLAPDALIETVPDLSVARGLGHCAERHHVKLLAIGSARSAPAGRTRIGRRGRQLLQDTAFALGVARHGLHQDGLALRRVGVGYDDGPESAAALELAAVVARGAGAQLAVHTVIDNRAPAFGAAWSLGELASTWEQSRELAHAQAERAATATGVANEVTSAIGDPAHELRRLTDEVDLLVVGSRRWGRLARIVLGSVGEGLMADSGCSVIVVPRPERESPDSPSA